MRVPFREGSDGTHKKTKGEDEEERSELERNARAREGVVNLKLSVG